jgi:nitrogen-specific signal transduction histidine kinase
VTLRDTTLTVTDTGPGLPSSIAPHHFQRFQSGSLNMAKGLDYRLFSALSTICAGTCRSTVRNKAALLR